MLEYREPIARAVLYIEQNLGHGLTVSGCARAAGYSEYHFIRVFREVTGLTPADYIRKRRLTEIIKHMRQGIPLSETALAYGFGSKENFTRSFAAEHHILPIEYKSAQNSLKLYEAIRFEAPPLSVTPTLLELKPFDLTVYPSDEAYPPNFWNKYNGRQWSKKLSGGRVCEDFGVCRWNAAENRLAYFIGIRTENAQGETAGTIRLSIAGGLYAVFETPKASQHDFVNTIHRTWAYINGRWLPESGYRKTDGYEFESYVEESRAYSEKIHIPIERKNKNV